MNLEDRIKNLSNETTTELTTIATRIITEAAAGNVLAAQTLVASIPSVAGFSESVKRVQGQMASLIQEVNRLEAARNPQPTSVPTSSNSTGDYFETTPKVVGASPRGLKDDELFLLNTPYYAYLFQKLSNAGSSRTGLISDFNKWARSNRVVANATVLNGLEWASKMMVQRGWLTKNGEGYWQLTSSGKEVARRFAQHKR